MFNNKKTLNMLLTIFNKTNLLRLSLFTSAAMLLTACSSLNQKPYDVDGIYNNSKIAVEDTHNSAAYYSNYFKEKTEESGEYFTDVDNYSSYTQGNGAWGDTTSETQIIYNPYNSYGWGYPYGGWYDWNWGWSFGFGYGWGGYWGYPYYGWGYPHYGWNYPYYGYRNVSRNDSYRALSNRQLTPANGRMNNRLMSSDTRMSRSNSLNSGRTLTRTDKTFSRVNSTLNRMEAVETRRVAPIDNSRNLRNDRSINNSRINNNNTRSNNIRTERPVSRPTYTPSSSTRMNTGSMGRSMNTGGGGMRSGGGRR